MIIAKQSNKSKQYRFSLLRLQFLKKKKITTK